MTDYVKCPVCTVGRSTKKLSKKGPDAIATFTAEGCEAVGLRHFGDGFVDRTARAVEGRMTQAPTAFDATVAQATEATKVQGSTANLQCPHCGTVGSVTVKKNVKVKKGVSGGKATAAIFTAGVSMLATGLSRKERVRVLTCHNCTMTWTVG